MKRRMFFGALAAAFCPVTALAQTAVSLSDFERLRQFFLATQGRCVGFRFRDWRPGPKYQTGVDRVPGRYIWVSPKRAIHSTVRWNGSTFEPVGRGC